MHLNSGLLQFFPFVFKLQSKRVKGRYSGSRISSLEHYTKWLASQNTI